MNDHEIYREAIGRYGKRHQMMKAIEEMSELTKELCKRLDGAENIPAICEEIADVEIMLEQLKLIVGEERENYLNLRKGEKMGKLAWLLAADYDDLAAE